MSSSARHLGCFVLLALTACSDDVFHLADGSTSTWSRWTGYYVAINYWAEWCVPCREEIPELNALYEDRGKTGLWIVGVNYDGISGESLTTLVAKMGIEFPVLASDPLDRFGYDLPNVLPTTVLIGPDHNVHQILVGPQTRDSLILAATESARTRI